MIGVFSFFLACLLSITAFAFYLPTLENPTKKYSAIVNKIYYLAVVCTVVSAAFFLQAILADKFQYAYVLNHSSRSLGFWYKVSVFWAGQEGSFLLWFLLHGLLGAYFLKKDKMNRPTFLIYVLVQALLAVLLLAKNPFMLAPLQADGAGLNPLLQDFWMVIHPPVIFIGYAAFAVPFAYALGNLLCSKPKNDWVRQALPWALFAWLSLGAGIFMGGYWAYKTLGWGGYWGWDPVENASLVPWLSGGALVHLLYLARTYSGAQRFAHFTAIITFSFILYGTFLTRSGVLSDFSVHAFSGDESYSLLAGGIFIVIGLALALFLFRYRSLPTSEIPNKAASREFILAAGALLFYALALLVFIGMSTPFVSTLLGSPQNVSLTFYNHSILLPTAFVMLSLVFVPIYLWNGAQSIGRCRIRFVAAGTAFLLGVGLCLIYGLWQPLYIAIVGFSFAAVVTHLVEYRRISLAATVSHIGIAVMVSGIIFSSAAASVQEGVVFSEEKPVLNVYNRELSYEGADMDEDHQQVQYHFALSGKPLVLLTKLTADGQVALKEPGILHEVSGDFYLADQNKNLTISFKPLIFLVWLGCILITIGSCLALIQEARK